MSLESKTAKMCLPSSHPQLCFGSPSEMKRENVRPSKCLGLGTEKSDKTSRKRKEGTKETYRVFFSLGLPLKSLSMENRGQARLRVSRTS